jgi:hypothetical protein
MSQETNAACCKVGRAIDSYDLFEFDAELRTRRQRGGSLRDLATFANTRILERALTTADADVVGDPETLYHILTDDEIRQSRRTEVESKLETQGVDLDRLRRDFVSHTTMRQHLQGCLDIDTSRDQHVDPDAERGTIEWSRARSEQVIEESLSRLHNAGDLETGPLEVTHSVRVTCDVCGESYRLHELLDTGRCACAHERD